MADNDDTVRDYNMGPNSHGAKLNLDTEKAQAAVDAMAASMRGLEKALQDFGNSAYMMAEKINRHLGSIGDTATKVASQLAGVGAAVNGVSGAGGKAAPAAAAAATSGGGKAPSGGGNWVTSGVAAAASAIERVGNKELPGGLSLGQFVGTAGESLTKDLVLAPLRYLRSRINTNRDTALMASGGLNMTAMQQGTKTDSMMSTIAKFPGSIYGTPQDMLGLFSDTARFGASYGFGGLPANEGPRAKGFFKGVREMQMMNPMAPVGGENGLVGQLGGFAGDTGAQQRGMMLTGGAMSMIAVGGRQKSLSEWAESILRWFEGLRPGKDRGKGFDYGQLMAQYFPGSNIDAWFQATGVPQNMRDYWWTYALAKASKTADTSKGGFTIGAPDENNVAWQRLRSGSELTRTEFSLAGQMAPQYAQRESSNRWFNELMGQVQQKIIPKLSKGPLAWIQFLPDALEDLMMTGAERGAEALFGGDVDNGGIGDIAAARSRREQRSVGVTGSKLDAPTNGFKPSTKPTGDVGDAYGAMGGTGLSGLHPDMKSKIGAMMRANPRVKINSGLRDIGLQRKLRADGNKNVSGKSSAHTRGMAADLGPRSEYGWIVANARKFGLASGIGHGEPWHVGMKGDVPGTGDVGDVFDDFIDKVKGFTSSPEGMANMVTTLISKMTGALGKLFGKDDATKPDFAQSPDDLYKRLAGASEKVVLGIPTKVDEAMSGMLGGGFTGNAGGSAITTTSKGESVAGTASGWGGKDNGTWKGTSASGRGDKYAMTADPEIVKDIQSNDAVTRGTAVARAMKNAGADGDVLRSFLKIAYRESNWTTNKWVTDSDDTGGGILGINQLPWTRYHKPAPFTQADVLDPQASAVIAMDMYHNVSPVNGPGGPNTFKPWKDDSGNPFGGLPMGTENLVNQVMQKTGYGDVEAMQAGLQIAGPHRGDGSVVFNNTFDLSVGGYGNSPNGGIDVRRTVNLIADHLEGEMRRRLKRTA